MIDLCLTYQFYGYMCLWLFGISAVLCMVCHGMWQVGINLETNTPASRALFPSPVWVLLFFVFALLTATSLSSAIFLGLTFQGNECPITLGRE